MISNKQDEENVNPSVVNRDDFVKQCQINSVAMKEIDVLRNERRQILTNASNVYKECEVLKVKYGRLYEKYSYLVRKVNGNDDNDNDQNQQENSEANENNNKINKMRASV